MAKRSNLTRLHKPQSRAGEGVSVGFVRSQTVNTDGTAVANLEINLGSAPVPDRRYVSDVASVVGSGDRINLIFGQAKLSGGGYRSLLIVQMSTTFLHQMREGSAPMLASLEKHLNHHRIPKAALASILEEPSQTVAIAANLLTAGYTGAEACMDFYYVSPFSVQIANAGGPFLADPVVRVTLPSSILASIIEKMDVVMKSIPPEIGR
jgi:hypothetical protein